MLRLLKRHLDRRRMQERGVAAIILAVFTAAVMVPLGGLAVDIGMQRVGRSDAQAAADAIALDLARQMGNASSNMKVNGSVPADPISQLTPASNGGVYTALSDEESGLLGSGAVARVWEGYVDPNETGYVSSQTRGCGSTSAYDSYFQQASAAHPVNAVLVAVSSSVGFHFYPSQAGGVCRSSVASTQSQTCFSVGSYAAGLNSANSALLSALNPLLEPYHTLNLQAVGYQGLANLNASLPVLNQALITAGAPNGILSSSVTVGQLATATASILTQQGGDNTTINALNSIVASSAGSVSVPLTVPSAAGQPPLLALSNPGGSVPINGSVNLGDLLSGGLSLADGSSLLSAGFNNVLSTTGLANLSTHATLIQGSHQACGVKGAQAQSSQLTADVSGTILPTGGVSLPVLSLGSVTINQVTPSIHVQTASATGTLGSVTCGPDYIPINVKTGLAQVTLGGAITGGGTLTVDASTLTSILGISLLQLLGLGVITNVLNPVAHITATISINVPLSKAAGIDDSADDAGQNLLWNMATPPGDTYSETKSTGAGEYTLPDVQSGIPSSAVTVTLGGNIGTLSVTQLNSLTSSLTNSILSALANTVTQVESTVSAVTLALQPVLTDLQTALGLTVPGADVNVLPYAECNSPITRS